MDNYSYIANAHGSYIDELYKSYKKDPNSVPIRNKSVFRACGSSKLPQRIGHGLASCPKRRKKTTDQTDYHRKDDSASQQRQ